MSGSRILLLGPLALTLLGQSENNAVPNPNAAIDQAVRGIAQRSLTASNASLLPRPVLPPPLPVRAGKCAVPLLEMPIPADQNFVITQLVPPQIFTDHMGIGPGLLSVCGLRE
jgi:hypothetical protein